MHHLRAGPPISFAHLKKKQFSLLLYSGYDTISVQRVVPPFYNMINQKLIDEMQFGVWLGGTDDGEQGGEIVFGGVNEDHYIGDISGYFFLLFISDLISRLFFLQTVHPKKIKNKIKRGKCEARESVLAFKT